MNTNLIQQDGGTQSRAKINTYTVAEYAEKIKQGEELPPIVVFYDGSDYWLADGFHRYYATKKAGLSEINTEVINGTKRDAVLFSVGSNAEHGLPRTNADKHCAVNLLLKDDEWMKWSSREIARRCKVSKTLVSDIRATLSVTDSMKTKRTFTHHKTGKETTMKTGNIGQKKPAAERIKEITALAAEAYSSPQIAAKIGVKPGHVRLLSRKHNIKIPGDVGAKRFKLIKTERMISETCDTLDGCVMGLDLIEDQLSDITPQQAAEWAKEFRTALKPINKFQRKLRGIGNGYTKETTES